MELRYIFQPGEIRELRDAIDMMEAGPRTVSFYDEAGINTIKIIDKMEIVKK